MGNAVLLLNDLSRVGTLTSAGTATSVEGGGLSVQNLLTQDPTEIARFTGIGGSAYVRLKWDLLALQAVSCLAIINHTATTAGTYQVGMSNNVDLSSPVLVPVQAKFWLPTVPWGSRPWGAFPWDGVDKTAYPTMPITFLLFDAPVFGRYLWVDVMDPTNPAGYWQAGRVMFGAAYRPTVNFAYGNGIRIIDPSQDRTTRASARQVDVRPRYRELTLPMQYQTQEAAMGVYHDFMMRGIGQEVFVVMDPDAPPWVLARQMFYCALSSMPGDGVANTSFKRWTWSPTFRELI
ncbi:hypothetical protein [Nitrospirillum bahiense]|uniref:Uncharacterized protein n=1 Tax=Nitrospirillum amazonense TaxID=28077 RepID=A0A560F1T9_9PROT|nr:hypothetical protein [Nitrospirillum amazonense]TWB15590.1 hypothetical protein FBZ88_12943 [Nitrospirillum amazonense]